MQRRYSLLAAFLLSGLCAAYGQYTPPDPSGFQGLIVEPYYEADGNDAGDTDGSTGLVSGAVTYRVFVDLKPGYKLLTVGGFPSHPVSFSTTTTLFNNDDRGEAWGDDIPDQHLDKNTVAIDSWLSMGAASDARWGVLKVDDPDGSVVGGSNNDGGSNGVPQGLLVNNSALMGTPLTDADGLFAPSVPPAITSVGNAPNLFDGGGDPSYSDENFAWAVLGGVEGPDTANRILIGQFTTDGVLELCFNLWVRIPDPLVCSDPNCHEIMEFYADLLPIDTAGGGFATDNRFTHPTLCFNSADQDVDCLGVPGGTALSGTSCDDGNGDTQNDVFSAECACIGEDCLGVLGGDALPGEPCDDNDPNTGNDIWQTGCVCIGSTGITEATVHANVSVGPNPVQDQVRVRIGELRGQRTVITLRNALGQVLAAYELGASTGDRQQLIDVSAYGTGVYLVEVVVGTQRVVERITKF
ncbi:MAG TPA: T9SS type A sorting domain-containing protein [Flavobacteriales bacterium]|jgi:hypothetical protein|nr:T9SS type A sorting domain-containing protein [Flavobacteriales bacterium]